MSQDAQAPGADRVISLKQPIVSDGETLSSVTLGPLSGRDLILVEREMLAVHGNIRRGELERGVYMIARASGVPVETLERLSAGDVLALAEAVTEMNFT